MDNLKSSLLSRPLRCLRAVAVAATLAGLCTAGHAADIDIYATTPSSGDNPNIIIALDNSSNWAAANQGWPTDGSPPVACGNDCNKQGYYELKALRSVVQGLPADADGNLKVNLGLVLFNNSSATRDGAYVRYHVRPMSVANKAAFITKIDYIIQNFNTETAASSVQYGAMLFDLFKYFGGHTNPANAGTGNAPATNPTQDGITVFGKKFWGSNDADDAKPDTAAYSGTDYVDFITSGCAKNYVILIGNGFPAKDQTQPHMGEVLNKLLNPASPAANVTEFDLDTVVTSSTFGAWTNAPACNATCTAPDDTDTTDYQCTATGCATSGTKKIQLRSITTTSVVTYGAWTDSACVPTTSCVAPASTDTTQYQCVTTGCDAGKSKVQTRSVTWSAWSDSSAACLHNTLSACTSSIPANAMTKEYRCINTGCTGNKHTSQSRTLTLWAPWTDVAPSCLASSAPLPADTSSVGYQFVTTDACGAGTKELQERTITTTTTTTYGDWTDQPSCSAACSAPANTSTTQYQCIQSTCPTGQKLVQSRTVNTTTTTSTAPPTNLTGNRYADEFADFLFRTDVAPEPGQQNVVTYAIDVCKNACDANQAALLRSTAKHGGGKYCKATSEAEIIACFQEAMIDIMAVNSVFASASLPVNATNRSQNENQVYIGMFRPDSGAKPRWMGNLKRYQFGFIDDTTVDLVDANGKGAINYNTGFVGDCVASFWSGNPAQSATYWSNVVTSPLPIGRCSTYSNTTYDQYADFPDGPFVEKGAVSQVLRLGNNPPYAATGGNTPTFAVNRTIYTLESGALAEYTSATDDGKHLRGYDVNGERPGGSTSTPDDAQSDVRPSVHGDVVHSRPMPVNYGTDKVAIYYGANDGMFRAVNAQSGKEMWAFFAPEFSSKITRLRENTPLVLFSGKDYPDGVTPAAKDYFFDGGIGVYQTANNSSVWVFPSMRRGGRLVYGLDVTTTSGTGASFNVTPTFKWRFGCNDSGTSCYAGSATTDADVAAIGQTWSAPTVAPVKIPGTPVTALITVVFGGGYDDCEDEDSAVPDCTSGKGKRIYIVNANTGALIRAFTTTNAVAADVTLVDMNTDGYADYAYAADTGGNLYRINFVDTSTSANPLVAANWDMQKIAYTDGDGRKFLFAPVAISNKGRVYLALGSGDREHPLYAQYPYNHTATKPNRFYVYLDDPTAVCGAPTPTRADCPAVDLDSTTSMIDATDDAGCNSTTVTAGSTKKGWFMDLARGEQVVTSAVVTGGIVNFSTNTPLAAGGGACSSNLGEARGYKVSLVSGSGVIGEGVGLCGGARSQVFAGGGLPPSPVVARVEVDGKVLNICVGCADKTGAGTGAGIGGGKFDPVISGRRTRTYWYTDTDKK